eukprot:1144061-Pelagomonas_calceolata.AAC.5
MFGMLKACTKIGYRGLEVWLAILRGIQPRGRPRTLSLHSFCNDFYPVKRLQITKIVLFNASCGLGGRFGGKNRVHAAAGQAFCPQFGL